MSSIQQSSTPKKVEKRGPRPIAKASDLPSIQANERELRYVTEDCVNALRARNIPPRLFVRSGTIVQVATDEGERASISIVSATHLRGHLTRSANFYDVKGEGRRFEVAVNPPMPAVKDILALGSEEWGFPPLEGITEAPVLRPDGTVLVEAGYDEATRLVYAPPAGFYLPRIPAEPFKPMSTLAHIMEIDDILCDFPFVDQASRANAYAMLLTLLLRHAIRGNVPMALVDAPRAGNGKGLLAEVASITATGKPPAMKPVPVAHRYYADEEWRKMLTSAFLAGDPIMIFDNVDVVLGSSALALAITATEWKDRILGRSEQVILPQRTTFIATGNNLSLGGDMPRRCYWIRLDAEVSRPWEREGFRHRDLKGYVMQHRGEKLAALLTLATGWFAAGKPAPPADTPILGSFEEWSRTIGGILHYAGIEGFLGNLHELYDQTDPSEYQWEAFLRALDERLEGKEFTVKEALGLISAACGDMISMPDEITDRVRDGSSDSLAKLLGQAFKARVDRRYGDDGVRILRAGFTREKVASWVILRD